MAVNNLNDFTMQGVVGGLLLFCLLSFSISFIYFNNPGGLDNDNTGNVFDTVQSNSALTEVESDADTLLNITANTNPEVSDLGSRDSVATSFSATGAGRKSFQSATALISWVFGDEGGTAGKILLGVFGGILGLLSYFYIYKHIRQGD